jgi:hypothetical protein
MLVTTTAQDFDSIALGIHFVIAADRLAISLVALGQRGTKNAAEFGLQPVKIV